MKIACIVTSFPGLSQTFISDQIIGFLKNGFDVKIFAHYDPQDSKTHAEVDAYTLLEKTFYINKTNNRVQLVFKAICLIRTNIFKCPAIMLKSLNIFKYGKEVLSLQLLFYSIQFLNEEFDVVYCHYGPNGNIAVYLKDIGVLKSPVLTYFHGYDLSKTLIKRGKKVYASLFRKGEIFLTNCNYFKNKLLELGAENKKIIVNHIGINSDKFSRKGINKKRDSGLCQILTIGRLTEKKGHKYAIGAVAKLIKKGIELEYIIAGDGPIRDELKKLTRELSVEKYIKFLGQVNQDEALRLYQSADIFLLPSVTARNGDQEGTPVVLMEAQAMEIPVVSTFHSGIPEIVKNEETGFLVKEKDVEGIVEKIEYFIKNPELCLEFGKNGRRNIEENFNIDALNKHLLEIFNNCMLCHKEQ